MNANQSQNALIIGVVAFFAILILIIILLLLPGMFYKVMSFLFSEAT